jgi:hypothetical protein
MLQEIVVSQNRLGMLKNLSFENRDELSKTQIDGDKIDSRMPVCFGFDIL